MAGPRPFIVEPLANEPIRGILLMVAAVSTFSLLDTTAKHLVQIYPTAQVVWARYVGHVVLAAALLLPLHGRGLLVSQRPGLQVLRSLFLFGSTCANFAALQYLQLAQTSSIMFSTPFIVAMLAVPLLGERIGPRRWASWPGSTARSPRSSTAPSSAPSPSLPSLPTSGRRLTSPARC